MWFPEVRWRGQPLMKKVYMEFEANFDPFKSRETRLSFFEDKEHTRPATASPSFVKALFSREIQKAFGTTDKSKLPDTLRAELTQLGLL